MLPYMKGVVDLLITHGIFSKGRGILKNAGLNKIMTISYDNHFNQIWKNIFNKEKE